MSNNTIAGFHIYKRLENGMLKLNTSKQYKWHIPKRLRKEPIQQGDIVLVETKYGRTQVLVMEIFREELEETNKKYSRVVKVLERAPEPVKS